MFRIEKAINLPSIRERNRCVSKGKVGNQLSLLTTMGQEKLNAGQYHKKRCYKSSVATNASGMRNPPADRKHRQYFQLNRMCKNIVNWIKKSVCDGEMS